MTTQPSEGGAAAAEIPVCPRHPDRESYVRCQRCERPVCPECQRPAAVGIQCVDCVRQQARGDRPARTRAGAVLSTGTGQPRVTQGIIALCVAVYVLQKLPGSTITQDYAFVPRDATSEPWRLLSAAFLHSPQSFLHILFNMYALWTVGPYLESAFGRARYAILYLVSAVGGSVGFLLLASPDDSQWYGGTVGASGAVFGLFGAIFVVQRRLNQQTRSVIALIVINFAIGVIFPGIAWQAHLGGLVTGVLTAAALVYAPARNRVPAQVAGVAVVVVLMAVLFVVKVASEPAGVFA